MATIISTRSTVGDELGEIHVDCEIFRPNLEMGRVAVHYNLIENADGSFTIVDGCVAGLELFDRQTQVQVGGAGPYFLTRP